MRTTLRSISLLVLGLLAGSCPLSAHHGNASYDTSKSVTVTGTVTEYHWANPHVWLRVDAKDGNGNIVHWVIEDPEYREPGQCRLEPIHVQTRRSGGD